MSLEFEVFGSPAPQGSKRPVTNKSTGRVHVVEQSTKVKPWRQDVKYACLIAMAATTGFTPYEGPVAVTISFRMPRLNSHYYVRKAGKFLREDAPEFCAGTPDIDKLARSTLDALGEAGVWGDDKQVARLILTKKYTEGAAGAHIYLRGVSE